MPTFAKLRKDFIDGNISADAIVLEFSDVIRDRYKTLMGKHVLSSKEFNEMTDLIKLCWDCYIYTEDGSVLLTDHEYDELIRHYINNGGKNIFHTDVPKGQTQWEFVKHEQPGMVGTIKKVYEFSELETWFNNLVKTLGGKECIIAPKFDGISSAIKIRNGEICLGVTRNDGYQGQDITKVVQNASNANEIAKMYSRHLDDNESIWIKTELVMTTENFNTLLEEKAYANRRSATSGIVNTPKNLSLAKYITIIPLAEFRTDTKKLTYSPLDSKKIYVMNVNELMDEIDTMLGRIRDSSYPIRTDGVVIFPDISDSFINDKDIMESAIAYKVNTQMALTRVDYGYVSVGRLGKATPMLHVIPVEVNETIVTDVSLGSFDKYLGMDIHEGEQVLIYSAGDVIPQATLPDKRKYKKKASLIHIKMRCPYCGEKLVRKKKAIYKCENADCLRLKSGRISNFIVKMKADGVSDKTIEDLVKIGLVKSIPDIFDLTEEDIATLPGYGDVSAGKIISEFQKIKNTKVSSSALLGAIGIPDISEKKCRKMLSVFPNVVKMFDQTPSDLIWKLADVDQIGLTTARTFVEYIFNHKKLIKKLFKTMNVVSDTVYFGNVVFTGFRDPELEERFHKIGFEVSGSVTSKTYAVIDASFDHSSTKCKAAIRKGISIVHRDDVDQVLKGLSRMTKS